MIAEEKNLRLMEKQSNYNKWLISKTQPYLHGAVLEIGCGIGSMTKMLLKNSKIKSITATDINELNLKTFRSNVKATNVKTKKIDISKTNKGLGKFDSALCINVLEHIKDDLSALKNINSCLKSKGIVVLILPALQKNYGTVDKADNHYRRYDKQYTKELMGKAGFRIKKINFMNFVGMIGWYYHGKILKLETHSENDLGLFDKLVPIFSKLEAILTPPVGLSLFVVGVKK